MILRRLRLRAMEGGPEIVFNRTKGLYEPDSLPADNLESHEVCPFVGNNPSLAAEERNRLDPLIGGFHSVFAGHLLDSDERAKSTSGGLVSYFIKRLFEADEIDGVIHLKNSSDDSEILFSYELSSSYTEASKARGTKYYPGEISSVVKLARDRPGKYAFIGLPCYVRAMRLLMKHDAVLKSRFSVMISLVCGHQKTANYTNYIAYQAGSRELGGIVDVDYRFPISGDNAHLYKVKISDQTGTARYSPPMKEIYAEDWSMGLCMPKVCQYCDDVAGEHADITFGDAWIKPYSLEGEGTNIVIARDKKWRAFFDTNDVNIDELTPDDFVHSQAGSFRFRREGAFLRKDGLMDPLSPEIRVKQVGAQGRLLLPDVKKRHSLSALLRKREKIHLSKRIPSPGDYICLPDNFFSNQEF